MIKKPQILKSKRISLRVLKENDLDDFKGLFSTNRIYSLLDFNKKSSGKKSISKIFTKILRSYEKKDSNLPLAIIHNSGKQFLGLCGLSLLEEPKFTAEVFYALLSQYQGSGYAIESLKTLFKYAFKDLDLRKIIAHIRPGNTRAWKVAERSGMKYMGQISDNDQKYMVFTFNKKEFKAKIYY